MGLSSSTRPRSDPQSFPSHGFTTLDKTVPFEEEAVPDYNPDFFYPVRIGELFNDRYQIVSKLGYGTSSTIWLSRDLE
jgi:serine/threonine-protein kinase SRPK3